MGYVLKQKDMPNGVRVFINADSNDWDLISTLNTYDLDKLEDDGFLICVKAMRDLDRIIGNKNHNLIKCFDIWEKLYGEDMRNYLEYALTEYLDIPRNDWDYEFCHTLYDFDVEVYKNGKLHELIINQMPSIPEEEI